MFRSISDVRFHNFLKEALEVLAFYLPLALILAPFQVTPLVILSILFLMATYVKLTWKFHYWMSVLPVCLVLLGHQFWSLSRMTDRTYFIECNKLSRDCMWVHQNNILGKDIRVWPFNPDIPILGAFKELWLRSAVGTTRMEGYRVRASDEGENGVLHSPLEWLLFEHFRTSGKEQEFFIRYPIRSTRQELRIMPEVSIAPDGAGQFILQTSYTQRGVGAEEISPRVGAGNLSEYTSFHSHGDRHDPSTWDRVVRNDIWLDEMPFIDGIDLVERLQSDPTPFSQNELTLLHAFELYVHCDDVGIAEAKIGCRDRLSQLLHFRDRAITDKNGAHGLTRTLLESLTNDVAQNPIQTPTPHVRLRVLTNLRDDDWRFETLGHESYPLVSEDQESNAHVEPHNTTTPSLVLEQALADRFPNVATVSFDDEESCTGIMFDRLFRPEVFFSAQKLDELSDEFEDCGAEESIAFLDRYLLLDDVSFELALSQRRRSSDPNSWRGVVFDMIYQIDGMLAASAGDGGMEDILSSFASFQRNPQEILYAPSIENLIYQKSANSQREVLLRQRRMQLATEIADTPRRLLRRVRGPLEVAETELADAVIESNLWVGIETAMEKMKDQQPTSSGYALEDLQRLLNASEGSLTVDRLREAWERSSVRKFLLDLRGTTTSDAITACLVREWAKSIDIEVYGEALFVWRELNLAQLLERPDTEVELCNAQELGQFILDLKGTDANLRTSMDLFESSFPDISDQFLPSFASVDPLLNPTDSLSVYNTAFFEVVGLSALSLTTIDWNKSMDQGPLSRGEANNFAALRSSNPQVATDFICSFWSANLRLNSVMLDDDKIWKHTRQLFSASYIEQLCEPNTVWSIHAGLRERYGSRVLDAVEAFRITPIRKKLLQDGISENMTFFATNESGFDHLRLLATQSLFSVERFGGPRRLLSPEGKGLGGYAEVFLMFAPWQIADPLLIDRAFLDAVEHLLTHPSEAIRQAALEFLFLEQPTINPGLQLVLGLDGKLDDAEHDDLTALLRMILHVDPELAYRISSNWQGSGLSTPLRSVMIDISMANNDLGAVASHVLSIPVDELNILDVHR